MEPQTDKPEITKRTAAYHLAVAGAAAMREAEKQGAPPEAVDALMDDGPLKVGSLTLEPLSIRVIWALEAVGSVMAKSASGNVNARDVAISILCFAEPKETRLLARRGEQEKIEDRAAELIDKLGLEQLGDINAWMNGQFLRVQKLNGGGAEEEQAAGEPGKEEGAPDSTV